MSDTAPTTRPEPADAKGPHWIVVKTDAEGNARRQFWRVPRQSMPTDGTYAEYFRHASEEAAFTEATRLTALTHESYAIYGFARFVAWSGASEK